MAYRNNEKANNRAQTQELSECERTLPMITVDYEKYAHFLEESDATDEEKRKLLGTLWSITMMFVDMGFGVHPVQQAQKACGQPNEELQKPLLAAPDRVKYPHGKLIRQFEDARELYENVAAQGSEQ